MRRNFCEHEAIGQHMTAQSTMEAKHETRAGQKADPSSYQGSLPGTILVAMFSLRRSKAPLEVVLYSKPGCHLCEVMKGEIERAGLEGRYVLSEVDIESDPELEARFALSIPVLEIEGRVAFKGSLTSEAFTKKLQRASR